MSNPIPASVTKPLRVVRWGLVLLGIVCLGIGLLFVTAAYVDLDFIDRNHLNSWPSQVVMELSVAIMLMGVGPWCLLQGIRSAFTRK
jgi:hypothetical protein